MFSVSRIQTFEDKWAAGSNLKVDALIREFMEDIADHGVKVLRQEVPVSKGRPNRQPGILEHVNKGDVEKHAGGIWTVELGVLPIANSDTPHYPRMVHEGTGYSVYNRQSGFNSSGGNIGGQFGSGERGAIRVAPGNIIAFQKLGERGKGKKDGWIYTKKHKGQKENKFMSRTEDRLNVYIRMAKRGLERKIEAII